LKDQNSINEKIRAAEQELAALDAKRTALKVRIEQLQSLKQSIADEQLPFDQSSKSKVTNDSTQEEKIALFRSLFRGREDVYPKRFESKRSGKSGYQPVCRKEWIRPFCQKPKIKCGNCENRDFTPLSDDVIRNHLIGIDPADRYQREFVIGVYPMLVDETCWFLAVDFDKETWKEDSRAYLETSKKGDRYFMIDIEEFSCHIWKKPGGENMPRTQRLKISDETAIYHVMSRTALDGFPLGDIEKDFMLDLIRRYAALYLVEILGFCLMSNISTF